MNRHTKERFGPKGNPTAAHLFIIIACLPEQEGVRLRVVGLVLFRPSQKARRMWHPASRCNIVEAFLAGLPYSPGNLLES
jgi:hypothetical protein